VSQCLYVAARLGIADSLAGGAGTALELAGRSGADPGALERLLRALAGLGVVRRDAEGRFGLTPMGELLRSGVEGSLRSEVLHMLHPSCWSAWGGLLHSVTTGAPAFPEVHGAGAWDYRARHPGAGAAFEAMAREASAREDAAIVDALALPESGSVVDVGGGQGGLLAALLRAHTGLNGTLFDRAEALAGAEHRLRAAGVSDRCRAEAGDFFRAVPAGGDVYLLESVLHDWDDARATAVLASCRLAMRPRSRLVVIERCLHEGEPSPGDLMDLHMLVIHGGRERTAREYAALLEAAGLRQAGFHQAASGIALIEAAPA
jgi:hypothetical protein